jgi:hypothetical protein
VAGACEQVPVLAGAALGRQAALWSMGGVALALGMLVYLADRPAGHAQWMPQLGFLAGHHGFGRVGQWLPSFVHAWAFSLFSAALLAPRQRWALGACGFWFAVNAAFEIGQHPRVREPLAAALQDGFGHGLVARAFQNYLLRGTFDVGDIVAAACGAVLAAGLLYGLRIRKGRHHAP